MTGEALRPLPLATAGLFVALYSSAVGAAEPPIRLAIPLNCRVNQDCFVQSYFDHDPGKGARDYTCGTETYDGHDGTDFRVPDLSPSRDLAVLSSAAGRVLRARDGMPDISVRKTGQAQVEGKECGNGLVIDHGSGWQTQYCHLAEGSVSVRSGDEVARGQSIGRVGMSGLSEFPHVHVTVRFQGETVDPFAFGWGAGKCGSGIVLWDLPSGWSYPTDFVITRGFADHAVTADEINAGAFERFSFTADTPALLAAAMAAGLSEGAILEITLVGPSGKTLATKSVGPLAKPEAQHFIGVGLKRPRSGWPAGVYRATFRIRKGSSVTEKQFEVRF